ncbi:hypothetical protein ACF0H5_001027 [Mactra antiquata]
MTKTPTIKDVSSIIENRRWCLSLFGADDYLTTWYYIIQSSTASLAICELDNARCLEIFVATCWRQLLACLVIWCRVVKKK